MPVVSDLLPDMIMGGGGPILELGRMAGLACLWANQEQPRSSPREETMTALRRQDRARGEFMPAMLL